MSQWWTYSLDDVVMFSPRVYWRHIELHNEALWPLHVVALLVGTAALVAAVRPRPWTGRAIAAGLALAWMWVAWSFLWSRYATINWPMAYVAPVFAVQGMALLWVGTVRGRLIVTGRGGSAKLIGVALVVYALAVHPLAGLAAGWPIQASEVFAIMPDPTAIATLGFMALAAPANRAWLLMAVPVAWCGLSWATLHAMGAPYAWILPAAAVAAVVSRAASDVASRHPRQD